MRPTAPPRRPAVAMAALAAAVLLAVVAAPVEAKEGLTARLDDPIAFETPPGTEILVGVVVEVAADDGPHPVDGSPIHLVLTGRHGATTRAAGAADGSPGHYVMRITIPADGVREAEVVMHGTSDLPIRLTEDPFTFGPVRSGTAQVAPPLAPPITPWPRASAAAAGAGEAAPGVVEATSVDPRDTDPVPAGALALMIAAVMGLLGTLLVLAIARRSRATRAGTAGPAHGA